MPNHRSSALAIVAAPRIATATSIEALWADRPALVARREAAADQLEALGPGPWEGDQHQVAYDHAHRAVWDLDEQIMAAAPTGAGDLHIKALIVRERFAVEISEYPFVERLVSDVLARGLADKIAA